MSIPESLAVVATFVAQTTQNVAPTSQPIPWWVTLVRSVGSFFPIIVLMVVFIWMTTRTKRKQEREKQNMMSAMKRGDRVQTIGGILGNVVEVRDDRILLKVDEGNNTKVWFARSAIHRVMGEEAEAK